MKQEIMSLLVLISLVANMFLGYAVYNLWKFDKSVRHDLEFFANGKAPIVNIEGKKLPAWSWIIQEIKILKEVKKENGK